MTTTEATLYRLRTELGVGTPTSTQVACDRYTELVVQEADEAAKRLSRFDGAGSQRITYLRHSDADSFNTYEGIIHAWSLVKATYYVKGDDVPVYVVYFLSEEGVIACSIDGQPARYRAPSSIDKKTLERILSVLVQLG